MGEILGIGITDQKITYLEFNRICKNLSGHNHEYQSCQNNQITFHCLLLFLAAELPWIAFATYWPNGLVNCTYCAKAADGCTWPT
jgi:hypothetical protein